MAQIRPRSPSLLEPLAPDAELSSKKVKVSHDPDLNDTQSPFADGLFDPALIHQLHTTYASGEPFRHGFIDKLFQEDLLVRVKDECLNELHFTQKETDIYKLNQTGDLKSLSYLSPSQLALLPALFQLRNALYSEQFRSFLRAVTGCGPLSGKNQDMSVASYTRGCHLLNHDDLIGTRRLSYILYMPLPNFQLWQADWGGALELYGHQEGPDGPEPLCVPAKTVSPAWNKFVFFEVQPGRSFHSVEEVVVGGEGEDGRERLSISGWFHAPQDGEEGYEPPVVRTVKSSREQLTSTSTEFKDYPNSAEPPIPDAVLSEDHIAFLAEFMNQVYLQPRTISSLSERFAEESSLELYSFLSSAIGSKLEKGLRAMDERDGLSSARGGRIPPHSAGTGNDWRVTGPPHKWRYCTLTEKEGRVAAIALPRAAQTPVEIMRGLQEELFSSVAFRAWLAAISRLVPLRYTAKARRFRPGLDYTLATSEEKEARLDVVLGLTHDSEGSMEDVKDLGWKSGDWGGWSCYMAPHEGEDDPAVYHSGPSAKNAVNGASSPDDAFHPNGVLHPNGVPHSNGRINNNDVEQQSSENDNDDDDGTLLAVNPGFNRLLLVLRDEGVMHFVKYVSAAAAGSRWDICGEYEIGVLQMQDDEGERLV